MATQKVTITLPEDLVRDLEAAARADGVPLSRLIAHAAADAMRLRRGRAALAEWEAEHGALTPQELALARAALASAEAAAFGRPIGGDAQGHTEGAATP